MTDTLDQLQVPYVIGGSIASIVHGMVRTTMDVDIVANLEAKNVKSFVTAVQEQFYIDEQALIQAIQQRSSVNLIHLETMFKIDIFMPKERPFDQQQLARRLRQVLHNLLANALRHTPAGGQITVRTQQTTHEIELSITDTGEGIVPKLQPHIFDRFYRAEESRRDSGGAGLGLAISKVIVEGFNGRILATSPGKGQGSTFTICLPIDCSNAPFTVKQNNIYFHEITWIFYG